MILATSLLTVCWSQKHIFRSGNRASTTCCLFIALPRTCGAKAAVSAVVADEAVAGNPCLEIGDSANRTSTKAPQ